MTSVLRDRNNNKLGELKEECGVLVLRDRNNNRLGSYNSRNNETRDNTNRLVGKGNLLTTLL
jgi:hypothetical protein